MTWEGGTVADSIGAGKGVFSNVHASFTQLQHPRFSRIANSLHRWSADSTIQAGQNNSVLLVGGRGSGKSLCIERSVAEVCGRYNTDSTDPHVGVVRLTGSLHADERIAFREIARQLCG